MITELLVTIIFPNITAMNFYDEFHDSDYVIEYNFSEVNELLEEEKMYQENTDDMNALPAENCLLVHSELPLHFIENSLTPPPRQA